MFGTDQDDNGYQELVDTNIEQICNKKGDLRFDGRCFAEPKYIFEVREFIFVFYGNSRDRKSRLVAEALNCYIDEFSKDKGGSSNGLTIKKGEVNADVRTN